MSKLFEQHKDLIQSAIKAQHDRTFFAAFPEHPKAYPEDADQKGRESYKNQLGKEFLGLASDYTDTIGSEVSPYTGEKLNIKYPDISPKSLIENAEKTLGEWRNCSPEMRAGILVESLMRFRDRFFEVAYATMHTSGQGYMMAFQASGPHAADRALEAIAQAFEELQRFPEKAIWDKPMGKFNIKLNKTWKAAPKGISVVIGCSTFPIWNSTPGIYASLMTGNPVIIKPHPGAIVPIAVVAEELRKVLKESGLPENIVQLAADSQSSPKTLALVESPSVKIIDFTGNSKFGSKLEGMAGKTVFTEKTGVNSVIIDGAEKPEEMAANLAFSVNLYSGQMCTAPQNFFIPEDGIETPEGKLSFEQVAEMICKQITGLVDNPKAGPYVLGAIQNPHTEERIKKAEESGAKVWLKSKKVENPQFPNARTSSPVVIELSSEQSDKFSEELFGPVAVLIKTKDTEESLRLASKLAATQGAISCAVYTLNEQVKEKTIELMSAAATPVSFNLYGPIYVNQNASFSDFHVTGGNPAGNASFTDVSYVARRFSWVGFREMAQ